MKKMAFFERYLSLWVFGCIILGVLVGNIFFEFIEPISKINLYSINIPIAILVWMMIFPMMLQIDFDSIKNIKTNFKGIYLTVIINWLVKPFTMALFANIFFDNLYSSFLSPDKANEYIAGAILLGAAPCTAMVFVWSYLVDGDANYTLLQVSINDIILLIAFIPIVKFLMGMTNIFIPYDVLFTSITTFILIPLIAGYFVNKQLIKSKGINWFNEVLLKKIKPFSIIALLTTLILLFAFQGKEIIKNPFDILLISIPLIIQTYFIFFVTWFIGKYLKLNFKICAPAAMIGASNFFELSVAIAISLFGLNSGAVLVTVVGVLIEVPIMLSLVYLANKWRY